MKATYPLRVKTNNDSIEGTVQLSKEEFCSLKVLQSTNKAHIILLVEEDSGWIRSVEISKLTLAP